MDDEAAEFGSSSQPEPRIPYWPHLLAATDGGGALESWGCYLVPGKKIGLSLLHAGLIWRWRKVRAGQEEKVGAPNRQISQHC